MWLDEMGVEPRFLIHDRDTKLTKKFREFWKESGTRCIRIPLKAPRANSMAETWIESFKRECLNKFICFGLDHLDYIRARWVNYYNTRRPHRGIGKDNVVLDETFQPQHEGLVRCQQELGGIIKDYYRKAA